MAKIYRTFSWLFIITFLIRMFDVLKNLIIASSVGVSGSADVFFALQFIPEYLVVLLGIDTLKGVVNSEYSTHNKNKEYAKVNKSFSGLFSFIFVISLILTFVIVFFREDMIRLFLPGLSSESYSIAVTISIFILPVFFFKSIISLLHPYLNSKKIYYFPVLTQIVITASIIYFIYFPLGDNKLVINISIGFLVGNLMYLIILLIPVYPVLVSNIKDFFKRDELTNKILKGCLTLLLLSIINQIYLFSRNYFASYFPEGSLSSISYGYSIPYFVSTFTFNIVFSVLLTHISTINEDSDGSPSKVERSRLIFNTLSFIYYIYIPIVILFVVFSNKVLTIVFMRGNFDLEGIEMTSRPFIWESLSLMTYLFYIIPVIMYLALKKYKKLMMIGSTTFLLGILLNYSASRFFGYYGISVGNFFTMGLYGIALFYGLRKEFVNFKENILTFIRIQLSFIIALAVIYILRNSSFFNYADMGLLIQIINIMTNFVLICIISAIIMLIINYSFTMVVLKSLSVKINNVMFKNKLTK